MESFGVDELVLLHLWDVPTTGGDGAQAAATTDLADALGLSETMADRLRLLSAISSLESAELVAESAERRGSGEGDRNVYTLTEAGRERALKLYDRVREERVVVHDGDGRTVHRLVEAADALEWSLASLLARRSPDGDLYLGEEIAGFVGRESELDRLEAVHARSLDGRPQTVLVTGEAGVGKTTLVEYFGDQLSDEGTRTVVGRCGREESEPYAPVLEAMTALNGEGVPDHPLAETPVDVESAEMYEAQRAALFYQVTAWLSERAREEPTMVVFEDLQWADPATIDLVAHVASESYQAPLLLVGTYRSETADDVHLLRERLGEDELGALVELGLDPFDRAETAALIEAELGRRGVPESFVDAVYDGTGGTPLFVVETVAQLREEGRLDPRIDRYPETVADASVPTAVEETIERRLDRLDGPTRAVLAAGAVVGNPIEADALEICCGLSETALGERIDLLVDGGVWERDGEQLRFVSDVVRSVVLAELDDAQRRRFHREVAEYLLAGPAVQPAEVAHHLERAGADERALEYYRRAGESATDVYAHDVAVDHYERALGLARALDRDETTLELLEALGDIHYTRGNHDQANKNFRYVRERTDDPDRVRRSYSYQARMHFERSEYDEAEAYARAGLDVGGDEVTEDVCWLTDYLGGAYWGRGEFEEAIEYHEQLRDRAGEIDFTLALGRAHQNLGDCYAGLGELERAVDYIERGVELLEQAGNERELAGGLNDLGITYNQAGDYEAAVEALERCSALADRTGNVQSILLAKTNLATFAQQQGEWDRAGELYGEVRSLAERVGDDQTRATAIWNESVTEQMVGHLDDAIEGFERALAIVRQSEANRRICHNLVGLATAYFQAGEASRAEEYLDEALELATAYEFQRLLAFCKSTRGSIERERGELRAAISLQRDALELVEQLDDEFVQQLYAIELARTLVRAGEADEGVSLAREAREQLPGGYPHMTVFCKSIVGAAQLAADDHADARETLESALDGSRGLSNAARIISLRELGRLELREGATAAARDRLETGRAVAVQTGHRIYVPQFDELLAAVDDASPDTEASKGR